MKAMLLRRLGSLARNRTPLELARVPTPSPGEHEILVRVSACGVCHTELDEIEGRTPPPVLPVIPGHQVVGRVETAGAGARRFQNGDRVGIGWIYSACGKCEYCRTGRENLCPDFRATGRDADGGYAEYLRVHEDFAQPIPAAFTDSQAAPLLCAGAIGYRSLRLTGIWGLPRFSPREPGAVPSALGDSAQSGQTRGPAPAIGLTGFGASAHLVLQMARHCYPDSRVLVFARSQQEQEFARELGATWAGDTEDRPPERLDCIIDTTPVWRPVIAALENLKPGGRLVINAIRKENTDRQSLASLDYPRSLWLEKEIKSVANVTRQDISEFLALAAEMGIKPEVQEYPLEQANQALLGLKERRIRGAKVLVV
jgi:propanol-preferring alcohol dehydrogenase